MLSIGMGEIQKNISIFTKLDDTMQIVDKRKNKILAYVYPAKTQNSIIKKLAGKYKNKAKKTKLSIDEIKQIAYKEAMREKYALSD